jgi:hypothetical protein
VKTPVREGRETTYTVANAEEGKRQVLEFLNCTKHAVKPTRAIFADVSVDAATFLSEGGANYLRNMNMRATRTSDRGFTILVQKTSTGLISGTSMTARFEDLMAAISADEISHGDKAVIIDGYILSETSLDVTLKFNVIFGEVPVDEPSAFVYPTIDMPFCAAATQLTNGINDALKPSTGVCLMLVTNYTTNYMYTYDAIFDVKLWHKPPPPPPIPPSTTSIVQDFQAVDFPFYHNAGIDACNHAFDLVIGSTVGLAQPPVLVSCQMYCWLSSSGTTTTLDDQIALYKITTASLFVNY